MEIPYPIHSRFKGFVATHSQPNKAIGLPEGGASGLWRLNAPIEELGFDPESAVLLRALPLTGVGVSIEPVRGGAKLLTRSISLATGKGLGVRANINREYDWSFNAYDPRIGRSEAIGLAAIAGYMEMLEGVQDNLVPVRLGGVAVEAAMPR